MVFAKPGTIFIEFVPTKPASGGPYSVHNFVSALGHKHWLLPVPTSTHIIHVRSLSCVGIMRQMGVVLVMMRMVVVVVTMMRAVENQHARQR